MLEKIIKETICKHLKDNEEMSYDQHGFVKSKLCHINVISFPHWMIDFADIEAADTIYLEPSKFSDTVSYIFWQIREENVHEGKPTRECKTG